MLCAFLKNVSECGHKKLSQTKASENVLIFLSAHLCTALWRDADTFESVFSPTHWEKRAPLKLPPTLILNTKTRWELNVAWRPRLNLQPMNGESESKRESGVIPGRVSGGGFSGCCLFSSVVEAASSRKVKKRGVRLLAYLEPTHPAPKFPTLRLIRHYSAFFSSKG